MSIKDDDLVIDYDDIAEDIPEVQSEVSSEANSVQTSPGLSFNAEAEPEEESALPEVEVDEWVDLEDRWEKDYFFVVFTDDELYQHAFALYYGILKDGAAAQSLAKQQVISLKNTLARMEKETQVNEDIAGNLIPILRTSYQDVEKQFGNYLYQYSSTLKVPYLEAQELLKSLTLRVYRDERMQPFILPKRLMETRMGTFTSAQPESAQPESAEPESDMDGGAPKPKPAPKEKAAKPSKPIVEEAPATRPTYKNVRVVFASDATPLPLEGIVKKSYYPMDAVPSLYLNERVEWKPPSDQETIPIENLDWKPPSSIYKALHQTSIVPFETVIAQLTELPSIHGLQVLLETHGYRLEGLSFANHTALLNHLASLPAGNRSQKTTKMYAWKDMPRTGLTHAEQTLFRPLKEWMEATLTYIERKRDTYMSHLNLLEKETDVFTLHPAATTDIYTLALRIRQGQIDLNEAAEALRAMEKQSSMQSYVDFLKQLLSTEWNLETLDAIMASIKLLDDSVLPERRPILTEYISDVVAERGTRTFLLEDHYYDDVNGWTHEPDELGEDGSAQSRGGDDDEPKNGDVGGTVMGNEEIIPSAEPENTEWVGMEIIENDTGKPWEALLNPDIPVGVREILQVVARMCHDLHTITELPLSMGRMFDFLRPRLHRLSQIEQLSQAFPDISKEHLVQILEQKKLSLLGLSPDETERFRKLYAETSLEYKKAILDQFLYALTWWVIQLQAQYIRNPKQIMPAYEPCMPVWAFYGTPMSSSDEKGMARYLVCVIETRVQNEPDHPLWSLLKTIPEKKMLDRIYKNSQLTEFAETVDFLKQQWKDRWKEVARKEKELEVRLETLEKATANPATYKTLYVELMRRLPALLQQHEFKKKDAIVLPIANSCCYQPLNIAFEPFQDFKKVGLYEHRERFKGRATDPTAAAGTGVGSRFGQVVVPEKELIHPMDSSRFFKETRCSGDIRLPTVEPMSTLDSMTKLDWNRMVETIGEPEWALPVPTSEEAMAPLMQLSTSPIRRALQTLMFLFMSQVSNVKRDIIHWETFLAQGTFEEKMRLMQQMGLIFLKERSHFSKLKWIEAYSERCMTRLKEWRAQMSQWKRPATLDVADGILDLTNYILQLLLVSPSVVSPDGKTFITRLEGDDIELLDQRWLQTILERRFTLVVAYIQSVHTPSQENIQDYYAMMRERLKESSLTEYNSKTIEEIKEMQDAKRLNIKSVFDKMYKASWTPMLSMLSMEAVDAEDKMKDAELDMDGLRDFRAEPWNPDDLDEERLS
jgi:hypothetical protein